MKGKIYFLTILIIAFLFNFTYGQIDYSVVDDFNRANNNTLGTTSSTFSSWIENEETGNDDQLQILSNTLFVTTSGVTGLEPTSASINFSNELDSTDLGVDNLGWAFHMDLNTAPTGWDAGDYSLGWVLAANENDFSSATVDGYAVVWTATSQELVLIKFLDGISGSDPGTQMINTGLFYGDAGTDVVNVRVEVDASGNWTMYWEVGTALSNPLSIDANTASTAIAQSDYFDDVNLVYTGPVWAHSSDAAAGFDGTFDNFNLAGLKSDLSISGLTLKTGEIIGDTGIVAKFDLYNTGVLDANINTLRTYLSTNNIIDGGDVELNSISVPILESGNNKGFLDTLFIPKSTTTGSYYIILQADGNNILRESNESNNIAMVQKDIAMATSLVISNIGSSSVDVSWTGSGADEYKIRYFETGTTNYEYRITTGSPETLLVQPATNYSVQIKSKYNGGWSNLSDTVEFTSLSGTQQLADNVSISNISINSADVNWDGSGADEYRIRYYETGTSNYEFISATSDPVKITVQPSTSYIVQVKSLIGGQWSDLSNPVEFTSLAGTQQLADNVSISNIGTNTADVSWNGSGADEYKIRYYETGTTNYEFSSSLSSPETISVLPSTTYTVQIKTLINGVWSNLSDPVEFTSLAGTQQLADNVSISNIGTNTADVSWNGSGADEYKIRYFETGTANYEFLTTTASPETISVLPSTTYTVQIKTLINGEWSNLSDPVEFTSLAGTQQLADNLSISNIGSNTADVSWNGSGADQYKIRYHETGTTNYEFLSTSNSPSTILVLPSTNYTVRIKSLVKGVWSDLSDPVQFASLAGTQQLADNVNISNIGSTTADVNWDGTGADAYKIIYYETGTSNYQILTTLSSPGTISVNPSTNYSVRVKSRINGQWSNLTAPVTFVSLANPAPPANSVVLNSNNNEDFLEEEQLGLIYPNPAREFIYIQIRTKDSQRIQISIIDLNGRVLKEFSDDFSFNNQTKTYPIDDLNTGLYFVNIKSSDMNETHRLYIK